MQEILCVIRHVEERTSAVAIAAARRIFSQIIVLNTAPFFKAVLETIEVGLLYQNVPLILALDGDVLLEDNIGEKIKQCWDRQIARNSNLYRLDFLVKDKFRGKVYAGCHLYNNKHASKAAAFLRRISYNPAEKRPESTNIKTFVVSENLTSKNEKTLIVGKHDYDQYYRHIYAKYRNRAIRDWKSYDKIYQMIEEKRKANPQDLDFQIALKAMEDTRKNEAQVNTDASQYVDISKILQELNLKEKEPLNV